MLIWCSRNIETVVLVIIFWKHTVDLLVVQGLYSIHKFRVFSWCLFLNRSLSQTFTAVKGWRCRSEVAAEALATRSLRTSTRPGSSNTSTKGKEMVDSSHAENKISLPCDAPLWSNCQTTQLFSVVWEELWSDCIPCLYRSRYIMLNFYCYWPNSLNIETYIVILHAVCSLHMRLNLQL